jgi:hypothetical protein
LLLALGAKFNREIHHVNIITAFLEALLNDIIYVEQPYGFQKGDAVCLLRKALYDLK